MAINFTDFQTVVPASWLNDVDINVYGVKHFGAIGNGVVDDTVAIQAAVNAALAVNGIVYFSPGVYLVSSPIVASGAHFLTIRGGGRYTTTIISNSTTADVFQLTLSAYEMSDLTITSNVTKTAGNHINTNSNQGAIYRVTVDHAISGIAMGDTIGTMRDITVSQTLPFGIGITISNAQGGMFIDNLLCAISTLGTPTAGIKITNAGALQLDNSNIVSQGFDLLIAPGTGQSVGAIYCNNTYFDTAINGIVITPSGNGNVVRVRFDSCWFCSHSGNGVFIQNNGTGEIGGVHFIDCMGMFCTGEGIIVVPGTGSLITDMSVIGGTFSENATGISLAAGQTNFTIMGATAGAGGGSLGNSGTGIFVPNGASDHYIISNNRTQSNGVAGVTDGGTGSNKFVGQNIT